MAAAQTVTVAVAHVAVAQAQQKLTEAQAQQKAAVAQAQQMAAVAQAQQKLLWQKHMYRKVAKPQCQLPSRPMGRLKMVRQRHQQ